MILQKKKNRGVNTQIKKYLDTGAKRAEQTSCD